MTDYSDDRLKNFKFENVHFNPMILEGGALKSDRFDNIFRKFEKGFENQAILRAYLYHFNPPEDFRKKPLFPIVRPECTKDQLVEFQMWLRKVDISISPDVDNKVPNDVYAIYNWEEDVILINLTFWSNIRNPKKEDQIINFEFVLWRKLQHELAHMILWKRSLKATEEAKGPMTPPGFFMGEAGNHVEIILSAGVTISYGRGVSTMSAIHIRPGNQLITLLVPKEWMKRQLDHPESVSEEELYLSPEWPRVEFDKKRKKGADYHPDYEQYGEEGGEEYLVDPQRYKI